VPPLPTPRRSTPPPPGPEELYDRLTVRDAAIGALWRHQSHVLKAYAQDHLADPDVAIELPTGSGKTLVGALIAAWRRVHDGGVSVFACTTRQLAMQAHAKAVGYGIDAVLLIGSNPSWPPADRVRGLAGNATIVTTYSSIFNSKPRIAPHWLVLDDAHGAEGFVASRWTAQLPRSTERDAYRAVVSALTGHLTQNVIDRLLDDGLAPGHRPNVDMVGPDIVVAADLFGAADATCTANGDAHWDIAYLSSHAGACCAYIAWDEILFRPPVVPTESHAAFTDAKQRVYLSATLGRAGELERSFGRRHVARVEVPADWERQGTGRRLIVAPGATSGIRADAFILETIASHDRALVLVPSEQAAGLARRLIPEGWTAIGMKEAGEGLEQFSAAPKTALIAANRYDGIDLPGRTCSLIVIEGLPAGTHLQERFLAETVAATELLRERIRCRIMQGMGRATRSRTDRATVLLSGQSLIDFLSNPDNRAALRAELQAEIEYALWLASEEHDLRDVIDDFVAGDIADLEVHLRDLADQADLSPPPGSDELHVAAGAEVLASRAAWRGAYDEAAAFSRDAAVALSSAAVKSSRIVQKSLAASYAALHASEQHDTTATLWALELARDATAASRTGNWKPRFTRIPVPEGAEAPARALRIIERLRRSGAEGRTRTDRERTLRRLADVVAADYEEGIRHLGVMLGFESIRPGGSAIASPDGCWRDGDTVVGWEAKSEQLAGGEISPKLVRQANTHGSWMTANLGWEDDADLIVMVSPRDDVQATAAQLADPALALATLSTIEQLAARASEAEQFVAQRLPGLTGRAAIHLVDRALAERRLTTSELRLSEGDRR